LAPTDKPIVILAMPRSGTHFLRSAIANGTDIVNLDEPFNPDLKGRPYRFEDFLRGQILGDPSWRLSVASADAIAERYFERLQQEGNGRPVLIDIKDDQIRILDWPATFMAGEPRLLRHILEARYPIIRLDRRDLLAQYASVRRAVQSGEWVLTGPGGGAHPTVTLDYHRLVRHMRLARMASEQIRSWIREQPAVIELTYETMIENDRLTAGARAALSEFLGCEIAEPAAAMPRKLAPPLPELVDNLAEIRARLAADGLEWLTDLHATAAAPRGLGPGLARAVR
jgi:hypothetical protein